MKIFYYTSDRESTQILLEQDGKPFRLLFWNADEKPISNPLYEIEQLPKEEIEDSFERYMKFSAAAWYVFDEGILDPEATLEQVKNILAAQ